VTGSSDDDPSGIATYSQVGAQFGYAMLWTMLLTYPLMAAIQETCARVGQVTGGGLAANLRRYYPRPLLYGVIALVLVANVFNLGADIGAMSAAAGLLVPGKAWAYVIALGLGSLLLQIFIPYATYAQYLKWLTLSLFAYVATVFYVHLSWSEVIDATLIPRVAWNKACLTGLIAVLGTTISPYLFFWQASQEVEEVNNHDAEKPLKKAPSQATTQLARIRVDTYIGMGLSNIVAYFIILTTAATLHAHGITDVVTSAQAAQALAPLAGPWAERLFACGIIGTGLLAMPVLAGSAAYAIGEAWRWPASLKKKPHQAPAFYMTIVVATVAGIGLAFLRIDPIRALFWAAVLNGILAAPLMAVILHMARSQRVMSKFIIPRYLRVAGWAATLLMFGASLGMFLTWKQP
jgi:NRAMP (natural resistance-associated macrophage protein)-like metal ion transporter